MTKIRGNGTREVVCAVTIVKNIPETLPTPWKHKLLFRTLIIWEQSLEQRSTDLEALEAVPGAAIFLNMAGVIIVIMNGKGALSAPRGNIWLGGGGSAS